MHVTFDKLPETSRLWIYQANRKLSENEQQIISDRLLSFNEQWKVHGQPLMASFDIRFDHFIILGVDEQYNATSGCSIDSSVNNLKEISNTLTLNFLDRSKVAFLKENKVELIALADLSNQLKEGRWQGSTLTFNNVITTKAELESKWLVPASETWLKRYLSSVTIIK